MSSGLDAIVAADEEARARVTFAEKRLQRDIGTARADRQHEDAARHAAAEQALAAELAAIENETAVELDELRQAHETYLRALAAEGERNLEEAARTYAAIVRGSG